MKKSYQIFVGIDVAKSKLDYCITVDPSPDMHEYGIVSNNEKGIKEWIKKLKSKFGTKRHVLFCLENTGVYSMPICYWLHKSGFDYWVVPALCVKRSGGISRGKTDKADAKKIAGYAKSHLHELKLSSLPETDLMELRLLLAEREKLIKAINVFISTTENIGFLPREVLKATLKNNRLTVSILKKQLKEIEVLIGNLVRCNETFNRQDQLLQSIPGVGKQTSVTLIAYTHAFTAFNNHRQFACFAGVAPFEYSSGSSIRGKTKVSQLANKKIKSILNIAALTAKKFDPELKLYFERKVGEGKNKMSVLNAIRSKIISRAFAVIHRNSKYEKIIEVAA